ncbi:MAG: UPF0280 family protein [Marinibacterium sp.]|nr:UPF0280 family protein [Marinibacterium sp.]
MGPRAVILGDGRLHLQHGPIDLLVTADGDRTAAYAAARARFDTILSGLVEDLPLLRAPMDPAAPPPAGPVARRMHDAVRRHAGVFVTPMAAVAGAVADEVLGAMRDAADLRRASVNNGGDIALWLAPGARFRIAVAGLDGADLGRVGITAGDGIGGIATSGRGGRSLGFGIADSVTVLAHGAAAADVAATLIANAVDLPGHPAIARAPAHSIRDDSDLGARPVVVGVGPLDPAECQSALQRGLRVARDMQARGLIRAAYLVLRGQACQTDHAPVTPPPIQQEPAHA